MKKISEKEMDDLRAYQNFYLTTRHPYLKLDTNSKSTLKELLDFWSYEKKDLESKEDASLKIGKFLLPVLTGFAPPNLDAIGGPDSEKAVYKEMIAKGLADTQRIVKKYLVRLEDGENVENG